jgi:hypothetical protein
MKKAAEAAFSLSFGRVKLTQKALAPAVMKPSKSASSRHSSASLKLLSDSESGRDNWIRTNDPHHVKVVL